ncbi:MAG: HAD-IIB family hydrolase [Gammaproteobacteria bacterium]|nr:HAD-IIB family hydrolase [Gammaproteobacteria bacterium]
MYYLALATDYDGTLAHGGVVDARTQDALQRFKDTGRRLILVTGRELPDLSRVYRDLGVFDRVVAENGAVLFDPATETETVLAEPPPPVFVERLKERKVEPLSLGRAIVATWEPEEKVVIELIRDLGLELQVIFNKGAVMVLPPGINKASGLKAALEDLGLSPHNVVAVGDAENDHAFMHACGCAAAVANALPFVKEEAHVRLTGERGEGVVELMERICNDEGSMVPPERHGILIGETRAGRPCLLEPHAGSVLIAGTSGIGKSTLATALTERMEERGFEFCVFDPEGDYDELEHAVSLGDAETPPRIEEALKLLQQARTNVVINTQCFAPAERPAFFAQLLPQIGALRARTGRPHWLLIDEAHHLLPARRGEFSVVLPEELHGVILITVHPQEVSSDALETVSTVIALGEDPAAVLAPVAAVARVEPPRDIAAPAGNEVLLWAVGPQSRPFAVVPEAPKQARHRHTRKYAEGRLGEDRSFYFRGPRNRLNLRAHNLMLFLQMAAGVDDETWEHHRRAGDYSRWFRDAIKDEDLARAAEAIESDRKLDALASRAEMDKAVRRRYTAPASGA